MRVTGTGVMSVGGESGFVSSRNAFDLLRAIAEIEVAEQPVERLVLEHQDHEMADLVERAHEWRRRPSPPMPRRSGDSCRRSPCPCPRAGSRRAASPRRDA